jgi:hypothetical protein
MLYVAAPLQRSGDNGKSAEKKQSATPHLQDPFCSSTSTYAPLTL